MADTFTVQATGITWAANKFMLSLLNTHASKVVKVYRIWFNNNNITGVTGGVCYSYIYPCTGTSQSGGSALTPVKHNPSQSNLPSEITIRTGTTSGLTVPGSAWGSYAGPFRKISWPNDECAVVGSIQWEDLVCLRPFGLIWDAGYGCNSVTQPITCAQYQGVCIVTPATGGGTYAGNVEITMEFTVE